MRMRIEIEGTESEIISYLKIKGKKNLLEKVEKELSKNLGRTVIIDGVTEHSGASIVAEKEIRLSAMAYGPEHVIKKDGNNTYVWHSGTGKAKP